MAQNLGELWHDLEFDIRRSIRYHERRRAFFSASNKTSEAASVLFGSGAVLSILQDWQPALITLTLVVTGLSTLNLVFGTVGVSYAHADLGKRFIDLQRKVFTAQMTEESYREFIDERLSIERDEPPIKRVVDLMCHNEMVYAGGYGESEFVKIPWYRRLTAHFINWYIPPPKTPQKKSEGHEHKKEDN